MPRDGSGVYTLPSGNPVVTDTVISSTWANGTLSDIAAQLNNVFTRDGLLGPTGPFKIQDGTVAAPGLAFASEPGLGWYRESAGIISMAMGGGQSFSFNAAGAPASYIVVGPRSAGGSANLQMWSEPVSGRANADYLQITKEASRASFATGVTGTGTRKPFYFDGPNYTFQCGARSVAIDTAANITTQGQVNATNLIATNQAQITGTLTAGNGLGMSWDGGAYNYLHFNGVTPAWSWRYTRADGTLTWCRYDGGGLISISGAGNVFAHQDIYCDDGNGAALISGASSGGYPKLRWTGDNWRVEWQAGYMRYYTPSNAVLFTWDVTGSFQQTSANAYKPGGGAWADTSDARVKHDVRDYRSGLKEVLALRPRVFKFKPETGRAQLDYVGLIYQEAGAMPEMHAPVDTKLGDIEYDDMGGLDTSALPYALVNSIRTLHERIAYLESRTA